MNRQRLRGKDSLKSPADVAKLVDALDLGSSVEIRAGSIPVLGTIILFFLVITGDPTSRPQDNPGIYPMNLLDRRRINSHHQLLPFKLSMASKIKE